jgi:hypothetical protein
MIYRLIDIKRRAAEAAETAHVAAHHATLTAEHTLQHAVTRWKEVADLAHRDWLRKIVADAEQELFVARSDEAMKRELMSEARIELRRYEAWLANMNELQRIEAERAQREGRVQNG